MKNYHLTVFNQKGEKLLDEAISAPNDEKAKEIGKNKLADQGYSEHTHRCVTPNGKLILFHR